MEQGLRSNEVFIKKKSSSGCLIIKKKIGLSSGGVGPFPSKGFGSNEEKEKRNFGRSVSGSSEDSLEPNCREILPRDYRFYNGSAMYAEGILGNNRLAQNGEFEGERRKFEGILGNDSFGRNGEFVGERKRKFEGTLGNDSFGRNGEFVGERKRKFEGILRNDSFGRNGEFVGERKRKFEGILGNNRFCRNVEFEGERRRKFDDVAFDENVGMYGKRIRKDDIEDRYTVRREFKTESGGYGVNEYRNRPCFGTSSAIEARLPVSPLRQKFRVTIDKPIRVQGKNGVLKVMINKSKNAHVLRRFYDKYIEDVDRSISMPEIDVNTKSSVGASLHSGLNHCEIGDSSVRTRKTEPKLQKSSSKRATDDLETNGIDLALKPTSTLLVNREKNMHTTHKSYEYQQRDLVRRDSNLEIDTHINTPVTPAFSSDSKISKNGNSLLKPGKCEIKLQTSLFKRAKTDGSETEGSDSSLKREPKGEAVGSSSKRVKIDDKTPPAEKTIVVTCKETKVRRGTGTEKQLLREKIKHKLLTAGWTINYKPRKNRDYLDAVYINPAGTAYWSIIKAYEAFKKQMGEEDVPKELLNKLTRQTRKKMDNEMKMKRRENAIDYDSAKEEAEEVAEDDNNDEKISFLKKKNSKSLKRKAEKPSTDTNSRMTQERKTQKIGRSTLLVRGSDKGSKSQNDDYVPYMGKRTLLSWLIDSGTVNESAEVEYMNRKINKALLKGWIGRNGIRCGCCNKILTVSKFEIHAGSKLQQPFQNIYLENGFSLLQCLIEAWNKQDKAKRCGFYNLNIKDDDENDDACGLCGDGGDLMCCDGCPSTFHQSCIGIQTLPLGDWHCPNCTCKFCERSSAQGNALLTCRLCERKYHKSCKEEIDALSADVYRDTDFCGKKCQEVFNKLHKLLEVKHELESGFSWSLIHRTDIDTDVTQRGFPQMVECNSKLAVALSVIEECFLPINDRRSGINLIHNVLYNRGSNYSRLNHSGFYTAILERGDEIIAAASVRIHGTQLAEMPFIGTRHIYRRQGMCRRLLCAIESALSSLKVGKLIIPAIAEDMHTWIGAFSFNLLKKSHKKEMRSLNMLVFPRTEMLQKMLMEQNTIEKHLTAESGAKSILSKEQLHFKTNVNKISDCDPSFGHDFNGCDASLKSPPKADEKTALIDSSLRVNISNNTASSNGSSDIPSEFNLKAMSKDKSNGVGFDAHSAPLDYSIDVHSSEDVHLENIEVVGPIGDLLGDNSTPNVELVKKDQDNFLKQTANETDEALANLNSRKA